ncbi:hypothetical protein J6590_106882, partial [Homalodisca vitripennis]
MDATAKELHRPGRKNYLRRKVTLKGLNDLYQAFLVEMIPYSRNNSVRRIDVCLRHFVSYPLPPPTKSSPLQQCFSQSVPNETAWCVVACVRLNDGKALSRQTFMIKLHKELCEELQWQRLSQPNLSRELRGTKVLGLDKSEGNLFHSKDKENTAIFVNGRRRECQVLIVVVE